MKTDNEIREDVIRELQLDPRISRAEAIGVAVVDGAVTLTGHVSTYAEKVAAAKAAERVYGVKAIANELTVRLSDAPRDDSDIARAIAHILDWNTNIPSGRVKARVDQGWVTLEGVVGSRAARRLAEGIADTVTGVRDVSNQLRVRDEDGEMRRVA